MKFPDSRPIEELPMSAAKKVKLDHSYSLPPAKQLKERLDHHVALVTQLQKKNKCQSSKLARLRTKVKSLGEIVSDLHSSKRISERACDLLSGFEDTSVTGELFQRHVFKVQNFTNFYFTLTVTENF